MSIIGMRSVTPMSAALAATLFLSGCAETGGKQEAGAVIGAVVGGLIGSQIGGSAGARIAAGIVGSAVGGLIGGAIGSAMDEEDRRQMALLTEQTLETGSVGEYTSPRTGVRIRTVSATPQPARPTNARRTARAPAPAVKVGECRTVTQEVTDRDGNVKTDNVSACKGASGWVV
jgi:Glycine zipper